MADDTKPILCGKCKVPLEIPANASAKDSVRCPVCGISEKLKKVTAEVSRFLADQQAKVLSKALRDAARGSKHLQVKTKPVQKRHYRFIVDL